MAVGWEAILPETAKALSAPVTKLIEVVAAGCGRVHAPRHLRKMAAAEGDAMFIKEVAKERASEVSMRAAHRLLDVETRRQMNIEGVLLKAVHALPDKVSAEAVDPDWATRMIQSCQDIGDDEMQALWAKLLAGEVAQPGSFSLRTLQVLSQLSKQEAIAFESLCAEAPILNGMHVPLLFSSDAEALSSAGLNSLRAMRDLEDAGLLDRSEMGRTWRPPEGKPITLSFGKSERLVILNPKTKAELLLKPGQVPAGSYALTGAGRELSRLAPSNPTPQRIEFLLKAFEEKGMSVKRVSVDPAL